MRERLKKKISNDFFDREISAQHTEQDEPHCRTDT